MRLSIESETVGYLLNRERLGGLGKVGVSVLPNDCILLTSSTIDGAFKQGEIQGAKNRKYLALIAKGESGDVLELERSITDGIVDLQNPDNNRPCPTDIENAIVYGYDNTTSRTSGQELIAITNRVKKVFTKVV